jgi:hypothetical protein
VHITGISILDEFTNNPGFRVSVQSQLSKLNEKKVYEENVRQRAKILEQEERLKKERNAIEKKLNR